MIEFRNKVIHKGYIPTLDEAIKFGEAVHQCIMSVISKLELNEDESLSEFYNSILPKAQGSQWTVSESPKAISLNTRNKTPDITKPTRCKKFSAILEIFKLKANL